MSHRTLLIALAIGGTAFGCAGGDEVRRDRFHESGGSGGGDGGYGGAGAAATNSSSGVGAQGPTSSSVGGGSTTNSSSSGSGPSTTGAGGSPPVCNDTGPGEPNDTEATATNLGDIDDCDSSALSVDGVLAG